MTEICRNAPCPCGSGRKYEQCCLGKVQTRAQTGPTDEERRRAAAKEENLRRLREGAKPSVPRDRPTKPAQVSPRIGPWLEHWFPDEKDRRRVVEVARNAKGKWSGQAGVGKFQGWVSEKAGMPIRVDALWDAPKLEGFCSKCGILVLCPHVAGLALSLDGGAEKAPKPREFSFPCMPKLHLARWSTPSFRRKPGSGTGAMLRFRYGTKEVAEHDRSESVTWVDEEGPAFCRRDLESEERFRNEIEALDWISRNPGGARTPPESGVEGVLDFLETAAPRLREEGWQIHVDENLELKFLEIGSWSGSWKTGKAGWFDLALKVGFEGGSVDLVELCTRILSGPSLDATLAHLRAGRSLTIETDAGMLRLPPDRLLPILAGMAFLVESEGVVGRASALIAASLDALGLAPEEFPEPERILRLREDLRSVEAPKDVDIPAGLRADLRPYQRKGLSWLRWVSEHGFGGILADDMGLGKTLQTIALVAVERATKGNRPPCLVVCPTSLAPNWMSEFGKFAPHLKVEELRGAQRHGKRDAASTADVVVTTYPLLSRDEEWLLAREWDLLVLDEAQNLKNVKAQARQVAASMKVRSRIALSGTPLENHLGDLWSLFDLVVPGLLGARKAFDAGIRPRIEKLADDGLRDRLRRVVSPFLMRRTKEEVASDLPEKTEIVCEVELSGRQREIYETVRASQDERLRDVLREKGFASSSIQILDALLRLRQACCDPRLLPEAIAKGALESAKMEWLAENLPEMVEEGRKILVFSQFTKFLDLVEAFVVGSGIPFSRLDGSTRDRGAVVEKFQTGDVPVFLLSLKAGGTGLNLTAADTVVFLDPWWNPAVEAQAMDRAHRIGQVKPVFVYKLVAKGTVERRILDLQSAKAELAASILDGGGAAHLEFTQEVLTDLFRPLE